MKDLLKLLILLPLYFAVGPMLGRWAAQNWQRVRWIFAAMVFFPAMAPGKFTLFMVSVEFYRGHTKGFEGNLIEVLAIAIITASSLNRYPGWKKYPPGFGLYLTWCGLSAISLIAATQYSMLYATMALVKFSKASLMLLGAYHYLRDETDLRWALRCMAAPLAWYGYLALSAKVSGVWQFKGYFEHQNPMSMWIYLMAIPLFGAALIKSTPHKDFLIYIICYGCGALAVLLSVSRAGLAALVAGTGIVLLMAWVRNANARVISITISGIVTACLVVTFAFGSFTARLNAVKESAETNEFDLRDILIFQSQAMLADSPIGIGWNCFGLANSRPMGNKYSAIAEDWEVSRGFTLVEENYYANPLTESLYWLLLSENGYQGFISFVLFEAATIYFAVRGALRFKGSLTGVFAAGLGVSLLICYGHGTVERILTQTKNLSEWMLLCGLLCAIEQRRRLLNRVAAGLPLTA